MRLPKYAPGTIVVGIDEESGKETCFTVSNAFVEHDEWHYENVDGEQLHDSEIKGVISGHVFYENFPIVIHENDSFDEMMKEDELEKEWLDKQVRGKEEELRNVKHIEVKDGKEKS